VSALESTLSTVVFLTKLFTKTASKLSVIMLQKSRTDIYLSLRSSLRDTQLLHFQHRDTISDGKPTKSLIHNKNVYSWKIELSYSLNDAHTGPNLYKKLPKTHVC